MLGPTETHQRFGCLINAHVLRKRVLSPATTDHASAPSLSVLNHLFHHLLRPQVSGARKFRNVMARSQGTASAGSRRGPGASGPAPRTSRPQVGKKTPRAAARNGPPKKSVAEQPLKENRVPDKQPPRDDNTPSRDRSPADSSAPTRDTTVVSATLTASGSEEVGSQVPSPSSAEEEVPEPAPGGAEGSRPGGSTASFPCATLFQTPSSRENPLSQTGNGSHVFISNGKRHSEQEEKKAMLLKRQIHAAYDDANSGLDRKKPAKKSKKAKPSLKKTSAQVLILEAKAVLTAVDGKDMVTREGCLSALIKKLLARRVISVIAGRGEAIDSGIPAAAAMISGDSDQKDDATDANSTSSQPTSTATCDSEPPLVFPGLASLMAKTPKLEGTRMSEPHFPSLRFYEEAIKPLGSKFYNPIIKTIITTAVRQYKMYTELAKLAVSQHAQDVAVFDTKFKYLRSTCPELLACKWTDEGPDSIAKSREALETHPMNRMLQFLEKTSARTTAIIPHVRDGGRTLNSKMITAVIDFYQNEQEMAEAAADASARESALAAAADQSSRGAASEEGSEKANDEADGKASDEADGEASDECGEEPDDRAGDGAEDDGVEPASMNARDNEASSPPDPVLYEIIKAAHKTITRGLRHLTDTGRTECLNDFVKCFGMVCFKGVSSEHYGMEMTTGPVLADDGTLHERHSSGFQNVGDARTFSQKDDHKFQTGLPDDAVELRKVLDPSQSRENFKQLSKLSSIFPNMRCKVYMRKFILPKKTKLKEEVCSAIIHRLETGAQSGKSPPRYLKTSKTVQLHRYSLHFLCKYLNISNEGVLLATSERSLKAVHALALSFYGVLCSILADTTPENLSVVLSAHRGPLRVMYETRKISKNVGLFGVKCFPSAVRKVVRGTKGQILNTFEQDLACLNTDYKEHLKSIMFITAEDAKRLAPNAYSAGSDEDDSDHEWHETEKVTDGVGAKPAVEDDGMADEVSDMDESF